LAIFVPYRGLVSYKPLDPEIPSHFNILHRLELNHFAWHVFQRHPLLGTGYRPHSLPDYLADYPQMNQNLKDFVPTVRKKTTLDNMYLTFLVEFGSLMTLAYLTLIGYVGARYFRWRKLSGYLRREDLVRLLPLVGLAIHSATYDSLTFPQINWLFHVQLGMLTAYPKEGERWVDTGILPAES